MKAGRSSIELSLRAGEVADLLKTLSHPARLMIVCSLVESEYSVGELEEKIEVHQPHLSQHLTVLRNSGIVETRRDGKRFSIVTYRRDVNRYFSSDAPDP